MARAWQIVEVARRTSTTMPTGAGACSPGVKATWTRTARARLARMSAVEPRYCYRHPDRETGLACSDCGRPICADCATFAPVGIRCPDHAGTRRGPATRLKPRPVRRAPGIALASGSAPITRALIAVNVVIYLITASQGGGFNAPGGPLFDRFVLVGSNAHLGLFAPFGDLAHDHQWYRLVTSMFLHASILHIAFNMYAPRVIRPPVQQS